MELEHKKRLQTFSDSALEHMKTKDLGEIGQMLTDVVGELKTLDVEEEKVFFCVPKKWESSCKYESKV